MKRRVRERLPPPPPSLLLRRLSIHIQSSTEKIPRFRGVVADRLCTTEPETEGSEHNWRRHPRLSLLPSWAVRFRSRFALAGFGQKRAVPRVRILACQAGESDSLAIRLSEEQSSLEEYSKFEYHSPRHLVWGCRDLGMSRSMLIFSERRLRVQS